MIGALHGVDSERDGDRSYRYDGPEGGSKVLPRGKDLFRLNCAFYEYSSAYQFETKWNGPLVFRYFKQDESVYDDFVILSQPPSLATALTPTQDNQQQELNSSPKASPPPTSVPAAKKRPAAAEIFENVKDKDLAYYQNRVRAANRTAAEIKIYKDTMKNLWIDGGSKTRWLRDNVKFSLLDEACWHCTYSQANISQILYKPWSSSHAKYNRPQIANKAWILDRTRTGQDLIDRTNHELRYIPNNHDVLEVVNQDGERYKYLLAVHGKPNARYLDVDPNKLL